MARANPVARKLLADVVAPLVKEHGGSPKVAGVVGRHRSTITRWVKGDIDWDGLTELASGLRSDIVITFPAHGRVSATTKKPPPEWARALAQETAEDVVRRLVPPDLLGAAHRLLAQLAELPPPSDEAQLEEREAQDQVG